MHLILLCLIFFVSFCCVNRLFCDFFFCFLDMISANMPEILAWIKEIGPGIGSWEMKMFMPGKSLAIVDNIQRAKRHSILFSPKILIPIYSVDLGHVDMASMNICRQDLRI